LLRHLPLLLAGVLATGNAPVPAAQGAPAPDGAVRQEESRPFVVHEIRVEGNRRYRPEQLIGALGLTPGGTVNPEQVTRGIEELWKAFRVRARVEYRPVEEPAPDGSARVDLLLTVSELALDFEPRFTGNVEIGSDDLREWAGIGDESELFLFQAPRVRERLLRAYRQEGFYFVQVRVVEREGGVDPETGEERAPDVIFEIQEGPRVRVKDVVLHGNHFLPESGFWFFKRGLAKLAGVELREPRFFHLFAKKLVEETLDADIVALREVYRDYGFLDAVVELERLEFDEDKEWVTVHIAIDEGEQYVVGALRVEAIDLYEDPSQPGRLLIRPAELVFPEEELLAGLELQPGEIYEHKKRAADERTLRERYGRLGYLGHPTIPQTQRWQFLEPELVFRPEGNVVDVSYVLVQGERQFVREILIRGNLHTQDRVIRRLITVEPGHVADPTEIERSRTRIQGTGFFSDSRRVLEHREPTYRFVETDDPNWKDLEYVVEEGQILTFMISGGVSSNTGAFGLVTLSHRNFDVTDLPSSPWRMVREIADRRAFHGAGQELRIEAAPGTEVSFFNILFSEPDLFRSHVDRVGLTLSARKRLRRYESHDEDRDEVGFELSRQVGIDSRVYLGYRYGSVDVDDIFEGGEPTVGQPLSVPKLLKDQEGENDLASVEIGYRLRTTDHPILPRNGTDVRVSAEYYGDGIGSDFDFLKTEFGWNWYHELDPESPQASDRVHVELSGGVAWPLSGTDDVPYTERYFLGGQTTLRGFDFRGVGPNQFGFPVGGETMLYGTLEYRRPIVTSTQPGTYREIETLHAGVFIDAGILDPDAFELDSGELRMSAGFLFGLSVPLPITFSFGFPLKSGDGDDERVLGFNIGF